MGIHRNEIYALLMLMGVVAWVGTWISFMNHRPAHEDPQMQIEQAREAIRYGEGRKADELLASLSDDGNPQAQYLLATLFEQGEGVTQDIPRSITLLQQSASRDYVPAQARLGEIYLSGNEVLQNFGKAKSWLEKAAMNKSAKGARLLGRVYEEGLVGDKDPARAYAWYEIAVLDGDNQAASLRDALLRKLTATESASGQALARKIMAERQDKAADSRAPAAAVRSPQHAP